MSPLITGLGVGAGLPILGVLTFLLRAYLAGKKEQRDDRGADREDQRADREDESVAVKTLEEALRIVRGELVEMALTVRDLRAGIKLGEEENERLQTEVRGLRAEVEQLRARVRDSP